MVTSEILVVGAGIAGLATAVALQRRQHRVTIVEERADTSSDAGISLWPNALAALDEIGLGDAVRASGGRVAAGAMRWSDGAWLRRPEAERIVTALGEPLVVVRRSTLTKLLTEALVPGTIETGLAASELVVTAAGVRVTLTDGSTREAAAVVGADGVGSMVARHLNGALRHRYAGYTAWRGVAEYALDPQLAGETVGTGTEFGHVPLGPSHTYWFGTERRPEGTASPTASWPTSGRSTAAGPIPSPPSWPPLNPTTCCATTCTTARRLDDGPADPSCWWVMPPIR